MKAPAFSYSRPETVEQACEMLAELGSDGRVLAGGQSLMAVLNLRLSAPQTLVDINRIESLKGIVEIADGIRIGALVRHVEVANSPIVAQKLPLIYSAMKHVAHAAVRNRGTTCGSLALADPSAEMPACAIALEATLVLQSNKGIRKIPAVDYFFGLYDTARKDEELLTEVIFPSCANNEVFGFDELARRHGDFAMVGVAMRCTVDAGVMSHLRLVVFGTDAMPILCVAAAEVANGQVWSAELGERIAQTAVDALSPDDNLFGSPEVKRKQAKVLVQRVMKKAFDLEVAA